MTPAQPGKLPGEELGVAKEPGAAKVEPGHRITFRRLVENADGQGREEPAPGSERNVPVLSRRILLSLVAQHVQGAREADA